jgi:hypothetical protein
MTVRELLARTDSRELAEWQAYFRLEPFGEARADLRAGIIASTVANVHRDPRRRPLTTRDFMPAFDESDAPASPPGARAHDWRAAKAMLEAAFPPTLAKRGGGGPPP